jgi:hypothetical protein
MDLLDGLVIWDGTIEEFEGKCVINVTTGLMAEILPMFDFVKIGSSHSYSLYMHNEKYTTSWIYDASTLIIPGYVVSDKEVPCSRAAVLTRLNTTLQGICDGLVFTSYIADGKAKKVNFKYRPVREYMLSDIYLVTFTSTSEDSKLSATLTLKLVNCNIDGIMKKEVHDHRSDTLHKTYRLYQIYNYNFNEYR